MVDAHLTEVRFASDTLYIVLKLIVQLLFNESAERSVLECVCDVLQDKVKRCIFLVLLQGSLYTFCFYWLIEGGSFVSPVD
jgi:hypothetical protein